MKCKKCGKEISDGSLFCPYCGNKIRQDIKTRKKRVITVGIIASISLVSVIGVFASNLIKKNIQKTNMEKSIDVPSSKKKTTAPNAEGNTNTKEKETNAPKEEAAYPKEIILDPSIQQKLTEFIDLLSKNDSAQMGRNFETKNEINSSFATSFLIDSIWFEVPFENGETAELATGFSGWIIPEQIVTDYLKQSIGIDDFEKDWITVEDGNVKIGGVTPTFAYANDTPQIQKVTQMSETDIQVEGIVNYTPEFTGEKYTANYVLTLMSNEESMWGGYSLKEINYWGEKKDENLIKEGENIQKLEFNISASSVLKEGGYTYNPWNLLDLNTTTCWAEGIQGTGAGENLTFTSDKRQNASGLAILPGYYKSQELFQKNGKPLKIEVSCAGKSWSKSFADYTPDFNNPFNAITFIDFGEVLDIDTCTVTIIEGQAGSQFDDICISEMFLYAE